MMLRLSFSLMGKECWTLVIKKRPYHLTIYKVFFSTQSVSTRFTKACSLRHVQFVFKGETSHQTMNLDSFLFKLHLPLHRQQKKQLHVMEI